MLASPFAGRRGHYIIAIWLVKTFLRYFPIF